MSLFFYTTIQFLIYLAYKNKYLYINHLVIASISLWTSLILDNSYVYQIFPDQSKYLGLVTDIRNFDIDFFLEKNFDFETSFVSLIFALFPIPISSYSDIALINKIILFSTLIYLFHKKFISSLQLSFFLILPSIFVYSSLALKETFILSMTFLSFYYFFNKKYYFFAFILIIILCSRLFLAINLIFFYLGIILFFFNYDHKKKIICTLFIYLLIFIIFFQTEIIEYLNHKRFGYFLEVFAYNLINGQEIYEYQSLDVPNIFHNIFNTFGRLISPIPSNSLNLNYWGLFIENIFFYILMMYLFCKQFTKHPLLALYNISFYFYVTTFISFLIYNDSTLSRYRMAFIVIFILFANINLKIKYKK